MRFFVLQIKFNIVFLFFVLFVLFLHIKSKITLHIESKICFFCKSNLLLFFFANWRTSQMLCFAQHLSSESDETNSDSAMQIYHGDVCSVAKQFGVDAAISLLCSKAARAKWHL
jgi:hypothetical protein